MPTASPDLSRDAIFDRTIRHHLQPIGAFLEDVGVAEVMVNRHDEIYIERDGKLVKTEARFPDRGTYEAAVANVLQYTGKRLDGGDALIDARLPDGSRVHVATEPSARLGMAMTIRKFSKAVLDTDWLVHLGTLTEPCKDFLAACVALERNLLVAGGTSSGKTSMLNCLSRFIPSQQRIVVIEDSAELQLQQPHLISLEANPGRKRGASSVAIRDLFRSSLRLRPDRIIVGEVRGGEALDMIQAMTSGHGGSMGTLHANSTHDALHRLETMALMSEVELPHAALRGQISSAIDVLVHLARLPDGKRRVTQVSEVLSLGEDGHYALRDLFKLQGQDQRPGESEGPMQLIHTGERSAMHEMPRDVLGPWLNPGTEPLFG